MIDTVAQAAGERAGYPMPIDRHRIQMAPGHPAADRLDGLRLAEPDVPDRRCTVDDVDDSYRVRNRWWSTRLRSEVHIVERGVAGEPGHEITYAVEPFAMQLEPLRRWQMTMNTLDAGIQAWTFDAELAALESLQRLVTSFQMFAYVTAGAFVEQSTRSGAAYVFRRGRPTVAMLTSENGDFRPSCALCLHAVAYYEKTWAGGLVPTDDVIAHLMLMRADEHGYWKRANQHPIDRIEAGI